MCSTNVVTYISLEGKFKVILSSDAAPYFKYPRKPKKAYNNVITNIPTFNTPNLLPNDFGVFILFSSATTTPTASIANNVVPKNNGNSEISPRGSRSDSDGKPCSTYDKIKPMPVIGRKWKRKSN